MLADNDLKKIDGLIEKRLRPIKDDVALIGQVVDEKIEKRLIKFGQDVDEKMEKRLTKFGQDSDEKMEKMLKPIKDDIAHIRKDIKTMVNFFDREYLDLRKRVERIETHLRLSVS